jgi:hypothetical protein
MDPEIQNQVEQLAKQVEDKAAAELQAQKAAIEKEAQSRLIAALKSRLQLA